MNKLVAAVIGILIEVVCTASAHAVCPPRTRELQRNSPYEYALTLIDSLAYAKMAREKITAETNKAGSSDPLSQATEIMVKLKLIVKDFECAATAVEGYMTSDDERIKVAAEVANVSYLGLTKVFRDFLDATRRMLDDPSHPMGLGSQAERNAEFGAQVDSAWKALVVVAAAATYTMPELGKNAEEPMTRLRLTTTQRQSILDALKRFFGKDIEGGMKAGQLPLEAASAALYEFVSDSKWKSADAQLPAPSIAREFPDQETLRRIGLDIFLDGTDLIGMSPRSDGIEYRVTFPRQGLNPDGVLDFSISAEEDFTSLNDLAVRASNELYHAADLVQLYAVITCEPDRGAARSLIAKSLDGIALGLDTNIEVKGTSPLSSKTPAAVATVVRLREHLREATALLRSANVGKRQATEGSQRLP